MKPIVPINLTHDTLVLTQSDMDKKSNFGVDLDGRPVIFDAATVQVLPRTLADYTMLRSTEFAREVAEKLLDAEKIARLRESIGFESLSEVRKVLNTGNDDLAELGLTLYFVFVLCLYPDGFLFFHTGVDENGETTYIRHTRVSK